MQPLPKLSEVAAEPAPAFVEAYEAGRAQLLWHVMPADLETPVSAMLKLGASAPNSFLLESVEGGAIRGRYSFIGMEPDLIWRCHGETAELARVPTLDRFETVDEKPLASLRRIIEESRVEDMPEHLPPMAASLVGYMGYDMVRLMERLPNEPPDRTGVPDGLFVRPTVMIVFDTIFDRLTIVTPVRPQSDLDAAAAHGQAQARLCSIRDRLEQPLDRSQIVGQPPAEMSEPASNMTPDEFRRMVEKAKEYVFAGDVFQVVPSQRFRVDFPRPPIALYRALRRLNPSPFLFLLNFDGFSVIGSSPEILVRVRDGKVTIRPLAGTRKRGRDGAEDRALAHDLQNDPKEVAEHLMLLDLARNDVGRVSETGSVEVVEQFAIEFYSHVMHLSSTVEGRLSAEHDDVSALMAGFPAGTVSGAPKVRAMEIIDELEPEKRGIYAGCIGYFAGNGTMDTCIALRTAVLKDNVLHVQSGVGVVADSDPEAEYQESVAKASALLRAAAEALGGEG